jgi:hypothetical protein
VAANHGTWVQIPISAYLFYSNIKKLKQSYFLVNH